MKRKGHSYLDLTALPAIGALLLTPRPAWLWRVDGSAVLWANAAGARFLGSKTVEDLLGRDFADAPALADIATLAGDLSETPQMEEVRLHRGDGDEALWCLASRLTLDDGTEALLLVATDEGAGVDPLAVRAGRLVQSIAGDGMVTALARPDGRILAASAGFGLLGDGDRVIGALADDMLTGSRRLMKRSETFGEEQRVTGAAVAATPDGELLLFIIGPPIEIIPEPAAVAAPAVAPAPSTAARRPPRFTFSLDKDQLFTAVSPELEAAVGADAADLIGHSWSEIAERLDLDDGGAIAGALARHDTWSGVTVSWPTGVDGERAAIDLTAIPSFGRDGTFEGFRGFGVIRLTTPPSGAKAEAEPAEDVPPSEPAQPSNVVRLPSADRVEPRDGTLSGDEQDAFRRIAETLRSIGRKVHRDVDEAEAEPAAVPAMAPPPPTAIPLRLVDRIPLGIVVFREDEVLFANRALLDRLGYARRRGPRRRRWRRRALRRSRTAAGGRAGGELSHSAARRRWPPDRGRSAASRRAMGRRAGDDAVDPRAGATGRTSGASSTSRRAMARIDELEAVLDTATDGTLVLDGMGRILSLNRSAEALFGVEGTDVLGKPFTDLLAEESRKSAVDYLDGLARNGVASVLNDGREVIGLVPAGGLIPLFMTMGRLSEQRQVLRRAARHHALEECRGGVGRRAARGRDRQSAEIGIPRQDQPRDPHAAQRDHRLRRRHHRGALRPDRHRPLSRISQGYPPVGRRIC